MLVFGGHVKQGIDTNWHSHAVIAKTVIDLFALAPFGVPRVDTSVTLVGHVDPTLARPVPPPFGSAIVQPPPPNPTPVVQPPAPWDGPNAQPLPPLVANGGKTIPAPDDAVVSAKPPKFAHGALRRMSTSAFSGQKLQLVAKPYYPSNWAPRHWERNRILGVCGRAVRTVGYAAIAKNAFHDLANSLRPGNAISLAMRAR
jgi:hypothetical protein